MAGYRNARRDQPRHVALAHASAYFEGALGGEIERRFDGGGQIRQPRVDLHAAGRVEPRAAGDSSEIPAGHRDVVECESRVRRQPVETSVGRYFDAPASGGRPRGRKPRREGREIRDCRRQRAADGAVLPADAPVAGHGVRPESETEVGDPETVPVDVDPCRQVPDGQVVQRDVPVGERGQEAAAPVEVRAPDGERASEGGVAPAALADARSSRELAVDGSRHVRTGVEPLIQGQAPRAARGVELKSAARPGAVDEAVLGLQSHGPEIERVPLGVQRTLRGGARQGRGSRQE